jgi:hypothetical protein
LLFTDRYTAIDNREILTKMLAIGFRPEQEVQVMLDDGMMVVKVHFMKPGFGARFIDGFFSAVFFVIAILESPICSLSIFFPIIRRSSRPILISTSEPQTLHQP